MGFMLGGVIFLLFMPLIKKTLKNSILGVTNKKIQRIIHPPFWQGVIFI